MHKIFNKNTVKASYSCIKNMDCIISGHNRNIFNARQKPFGCNCRKKNSCLLNGECLANMQETTDLVTFTEEILNRKLFLCSVKKLIKSNNGLCHERVNSTS